MRRSYLQVPSNDTVAQTGEGVEVPAGTDRAAPDDFYREEDAPHKPILESVRVRRTLIVAAHFQPRGQNGFSTSTQRT